MSEFSTPLMRQYNGIKERYPNALLLFRLGDFYELFFEDAIVASKELQITLTSRNKEKGVAVPMCGVPYHAAESYISKLIRRGYRVAICDQVEDPKKARKLVKREVTQVVTPGTATGPQVLEPRDHNYLAAVTESDGAIGLAFADLSTGDFRVTEITGDGRRERLMEEIVRMRPRELLLATNASVHFSPDSDPPVTETHLEEWVFSSEYGERLLKDHFGVVSLAGYGLEGHPLAAGAAGAIFHYVRETQRGSLLHFDAVRFYQENDSLVLDSATLRNLELVEPLAGGPRHATLLAVMDECVTSLGARKLKNWLLRPSTDPVEITARLDAVEELFSDVIAREEVRRVLNGIQDLERILGRVSLESANARDLLALKSSLEQLPLIRTYVAGFGARRFRELHERLDELQDVHDLLERSIHPDPPALLSEGNLIRPGYHAELDSLREISRNSKQLIAAIETRERQRTGINSLKVRFNNVFGYYIEVTRPNLHLVPSDYERKQTLVNAERFTTPELKELEERILTAEERSQDLERQLFVEIRRSVGAEARRIRRTSQALAELDVLACFAHLAAERNYCRPEFSDNGEMVIFQGRHPVIEHIMMREESGHFIPNDLYLNPTSDILLIVTGPNMGGKSTYLRQTALIALMAQMGSFVPAERAKLPIFDRIFTRIGASDNLARGRSTFMVEMTETATILNTATPRSLVLLDEIGRGTATFDGLAIAWAVVEHLLTHTRARTLFATHYHELTELEDLLPGVRNYHVSVKESGSNIVFLRKVEPGCADKSYGIEVARLAGLPATVIARAREVLKRHEQSEHNVSGRLADKRHEPKDMQLTIFTPLNSEVVRAIEEADLDNLKPIEALNLLAELKKQIQS
ncbi:MAG TPA: DNA mismatch repair protein MutS [Terriglobia bacterium]|nr:DNA mismatch repair protein MutS [Terriglobia bacterium]